MGGCRSTVTRRSSCAPRSWARPTGSSPCSPGGSARSGRSARACGGRRPAVRRPARAGDAHRRPGLRGPQPRHGDPGRDDPALGRRHRPRLHARGPRRPPSSRRATGSPRSTSRRSSSSSSSPGRCGRWPAGSTTRGSSSTPTSSGRSPSPATPRASMDCARCGAPGPHRAFHVASGGAVCSGCRPPGSAAPAPETLALLAALLAGDWVVADAVRPAAPSRGERAGDGVPPVASRTRAAQPPYGGPVTTRPFPHPSGARPPALPPGSVPGTSPSSWTATAAGPTRAACPRTKGHEAGEAALLDVVAGAIEVGVSHLSAYAFSTENWKRSPDEVRFLMGFNREVIRRRRDQLHEWGVRMRWVGRRPRLWGSVIKELEAAQELTEAQHRAHPLLLRQLRRPGRDRRRRAPDRRGGRPRPAQGERGRRADRRALPARAGHARRRPLRPQLGGAADVATSSCGRAPTPRWSSSTRCGRTSTGGTCGRRSRPTSRATVATAAPSTRRPPARRRSAASSGPRPPLVGSPDDRESAHAGQRPSISRVCRTSREAVLGRDRLGPRLDPSVGDLDGAAAAAADEVVVVGVGRAGAVDALAVLGAQHVDLVVGGHRLEVAVDRGQADPGPGRPQPGMDLLGGEEDRRAGQRLGQRRPLAGRAALGARPVVRCRAHRVGDPVARRPRVRRRGRRARPSGPRAARAGGRRGHSRRGHRAARTGARSRGRARGRAPRPAGAGPRRAGAARRRGSRRGGTRRWRARTIVPPGGGARRSRSPTTPPTLDEDADDDGPADRGAEAAGEDLGRRVGDDHQGADEQQPDDPHRHDDGDGGEDGEGEVERGDPHARSPGRTPRRWRRRTAAGRSSEVTTRTTTARAANTCRSAVLVVRMAPKR